jgi:hypothetical protein
MLEETNVIKILGYPSLDFNYLDDHDLKVIDDMYIKHFKEENN